MLCKIVEKPSKNPYVGGGRRVRQATTRLPGCMKPPSFCVLSLIPLVTSVGETVVFCKHPVAFPHLPASSPVGRVAWLVLANGLWENNVLHFQAKAWVSCHSTWIGLVLRCTPWVADSDMEESCSKELYGPTADFCEQERNLCYVKLVRFLRFLQPM